MPELKVRVPGPYGEIPMLLVHRRRAPRFHGTVLLYHGLGASKDGNRGELASLAERGFLAVGVDAIAHGDRRATDFEAQAGQGFLTMLRWINETAREVPVVLDALSQMMGPVLGKFGICGISMGGYITYAAGAAEPRLEAMVPILGSPDWTRGGQPLDAALAGTSPHLRAPGFASRALLALNAGRDENVPAVHSRRFVEELRPLYGSAPHRLDYVEYPESSHFMREADWKHLWARTLDWFERHLFC